MYFKVGDTFEMVADKPVNKWEYDETFFVGIELCTDATLRGVVDRSGA